MTGEAGRPKFGYTVSKLRKRKRRRPVKGAGMAHRPLATLHSRPWRSCVWRNGRTRFTSASLQTVCGLRAGQWPASGQEAAQTAVACRAVRWQTAEAAGSACSRERPKAAPSVSLLPSDRKPACPNWRGLARCRVTGPSFVSIIRNFHPDRISGLYAALDLGTNNCRLAVAQPTRPGQFRVVDAFSRIVRLGEGLGASPGILSPEAMDRSSRH